MVKDKKKAEVLYILFPSVFSSRTSCLLDNNTPEVENRDGEQNDAPVIHNELGNDLLHHLEILKSIGPDGIHPKVLRELVEMLTKPFYIIYQKS